MLGKPPARSPAANQAASLFAHFYFLSLCLGGQEKKQLTLKSSMAIFRFLSFSPSKACYSFIHDMTIFLKTFLWFLTIPGDIFFFSFTF
jgi:hypothetical protein